MHICTEVKLDIDLEFQHPCQLLIRLLRILSLCKLMNYYVEFYSSATKGIHIRIYVPGRIPLHKLFTTRAVLGDDWMRLQYDYARNSKGLIHTMLFNIKTVRFRRKIVKKGVEKPIDIESLLSDLIKICELRFFKQKLKYRRKIK